ncbi:septal ring lytic transglycosylase RlpA family protein [Paraglaciecola aquimarina]|uniref:Endolytic peptidoglycan transglycosylase RlpA n=1 Tax=Paraglaciecola algarum TaxID=3050085 RepID=A0ABS9D1N2_9ALTE|nr:septal ring lytic transglycosylase RlpA family protein [Paraglaciecola sp. G1-23]MCF2946776.1 septal ring lytic transglycosylase RlpA family protein [Paraglaciecola sp. G1-23]
MLQLSRKLLCIILCLSIGACAPKGRYYQHQDSAPKIVPEYVTTKDAIPRYEPYAPANLRPYNVRGVNYQPLLSGLGYTDTGQASWYGQKFHGHKTSNGEIYDMYQMSAAHKTLPLPSYARITNLDNGKQVVVRVNDRGPFHFNRIVDLSYAAALKLDILKTGVGNVKLDVIHVSPEGKITIGKQTPIKNLNHQKQSRYIQVVALKNKQSIEHLAKKISAQYQLPYRILYTGSIYKLQLGPLGEHINLPKILEKLKRKEFPSAYPIDVN